MYKGGGAGIGGVFKKGGGVGDFNQAAIKQKSSAMGQPFSLEDIVRDQDYGGALFLIYFGDDLLNQFDIVEVKIGRWFIH